MSPKPSPGKTSLYSHPPSPRTGKLINSGRKKKQDRLSSEDRKSQYVSVGQEAESLHPGLGLNPPERVSYRVLTPHHPLGPLHTDPAFVIPLPAPPSSDNEAAAHADARQGPRCRSARRPRPPVDRWRGARTAALPGPPPCPSPRARLTQQQDALPRGQLGAGARGHLAEDAGPAGEGTARSATGPRSRQGGARLGRGGKGSAVIGRRRLPKVLPVVLLAAGPHLRGLAAADQAGSRRRDRHLRCCCGCRAGPLPCPAPLLVLQLLPPLPLSPLLLLTD